MGASRWMVALDESGAAEKIVQWMRAFPHPRNTVITLVHVLGPLEIPDAIGATGQQLLLQQQESMIDTALGRAQRLLKEKFAAVEVITREGVPSQELLRLIREYEPDLVISGRGGFYQASGLGLGNRLLSPSGLCSLLSALSPRQNVEFAIRAGIAQGHQGQSTVELESIIALAKQGQKEITRLRGDGCGHAN